MHCFPSSRLTLEAGSSPPACSTQHTARTAHKVSKQHLQRVQRLPHRHYTTEFIVHTEHTVSRSTHIVHTWYLVQNIHSVNKRIYKQHIQNMYRSAYCCVTVVLTKHTLSFTACAVHRTCIPSHADALQNKF